MIPGDDFVDFLLGYLMKFPGLRLIVQRRNPVINLPSILEWKVFAHDGKRNKDLQIPGIVLSVADALERPNHLKTNAVQQDRGTHGRPAWEKHAAGFVS